MKAMRGRIALQKNFIQNVTTGLFLFRPAIAGLWSTCASSRRFKRNRVLPTRKVSFTQYDTSAGIWNAGLLTRTSFQSQGFAETWCHSSSKGAGNLLTRSSNNCMTPSSLL